MQRNWADNRGFPRRSARREVKIMARRSSAYTKNLIEPIVKASVSDRWETAVLEWDISDCEEDESAETDCMCGHE